MDSKTHLPVFLQRVHYVEHENHNISCRSHVPNAISVARETGRQEERILAKEQF